MTELKPASPRRKQNRSYYLRNRERLIEKQRLYRASNREKLAAKHRLRKYGMDDDEFNSLLASQQNRCAICGTDNFGGRGYQIAMTTKQGKCVGSCVSAAIRLSDL